MLPPVPSDIRDATLPGLAARGLARHIRAPEKPQIEKGIGIEIYNSRGVVTRDPVGGGGPERQLVRLC